MLSGQERQQQERTGKFLLRCCPMEVIQYGAFLHAAGIEACVSLLHCGAAGGMLILSGPVDVIKKSGQNDFVAVEHSTKSMRFTSKANRQSAYASVLSVVYC